MMDNNKEILKEVQSQISFFDNKASILLSVVGIIFALTLSFLDVFHSEFLLIDTLFNVKLDEFNQNNLGSNLR